MSSPQSFRQFINERLHAAAEDICGCFEATVAKYEDEIARQRRLLDVTLKPVVKLQRIELPQQHVCIEEEFPADLLERNPSPDQDEPEPPQIKEQQEELCIELPEQHCLNEEEFPSDQQLQNLERNPSPDQEGPEPPQIEEEEEHCSVRVLEQKDYDNLYLSRTFKESDHSKPETSFSQRNTLQDHERTHTGEKPFTCKTCWRRFSLRKYLKRHERTHTGERPFTCKTCEKSFMRGYHLHVHNKTHTGEKPFSCKACGKSFRLRAFLLIHERIHTGEKPFSCQICGKSFSQGTNLKRHERTHTG